ncbi:MAG: hypothetical protein Q9162_005980 [Coniocarpon cinnabarinum]
MGPCATDGSPPPGPYDFSIWSYLPEQHDVEDLNLYKEGGFCPVHLGDFFENGNYQIVYKIAYSGSSTVWLARDNIYDSEQTSLKHPFQYVALKILAADEGPQEALMLERVHGLTNEAYEGDAPRSTSEDDEPGKQNIIRLIHSFTHESPNGIHQVLVMPLIRPATEAMRWAYDIPIPERCLNITQQIARGLAYLHSKNIIHGDLYYNNIGYLVEDVINDKNFRSNFFEPTIHVVALDASCPTLPHIPSVEDSPLVSWGPDTLTRVPKYLVEPGDWRNLAKNFEAYTKKPRICIIDFNNSFSLDIPPSERPNIGLPAAFRPPEFLYDMFPRDEADGAPSLDREEHNGVEARPKKGPRLRRARRWGDTHAALGEVSKQVDVWVLGTTIAELMGIDMIPWGFCNCPISGTSDEVILKIDPDIPTEWESLPDVVKARQKIGSTRDTAHEKAWRNIEEEWANLHRSKFSRGEESESKRVRFECPYFGADWVEIQRPTVPYESTRYKGLLELCQYLLRSDPRQRPSMTDVLPRIDQILKELTPQVQPTPEENEPASSKE